MIFRKSRKKVDTSVKKVDSIVTWLIIGGAAASIFGISRTKKWKKLTSKAISFWKKGARRGYSLFWKTLARTISFFTQK